jgi:hypothetical protein
MTELLIYVEGNHQGPAAVYCEVAEERDGEDESGSLMAVHEVTVRPDADIVVVLHRAARAAGFRPSDDPPEHHPLITSSAAYTVIVEGGDS